MHIYKERLQVKTQRTDGRTDELDKLPLPTVISHLMVAGFFCAA